MVTISHFLKTLRRFCSFRRSRHYVLWRSCLVPTIYISGMVCSHLSLNWCVLRRHQQTQDDSGKPRNSTNSRLFVFVPVHQEHALTITGTFLNLFDARTNIDGERYKGRVWRSGLAVSILVILRRGKIVQKETPTNYYKDVREKLQVSIGYWFGEKSA